MKIRKLLGFDINLHLRLRRVVCYHQNAQVAFLLGNVPLIHRHTQTGSFARLQHALLQAYPQSRIEYLQFTDLQRRTSGIGELYIMFHLILFASKALRSISVSERRITGALAISETVRSEKSGNRMAESGISFSSLTLSPVKRER